MDQPPVGQGLNRELFERGKRAEVEIDCFISRRAAREAQERAEYVRDHQRELFSLLERQHREAGNTVVRLAGETLAALLEITVGNVPGQRRGDIEGVLRLLQSYAQATEVGKYPKRTSP